MKNYNSKPAPSKLVAQFDNQLIKILMEDLKAFHDKNPSIHKAVIQQKQAA